MQNNTKTTGNDMAGRDTDLRGKVPREGKVVSKKKKNNPNGANQYVADPRQNDFLVRWLDPKSETYSNCLQSALAAGYDKDYAAQLTARMPDWLLEKVKDQNLLQKALKNLDEFLGDDEKQYKFKATELVTKGLHKSFKSEEPKGNTYITNTQINISKEKVELIEEMERKLMELEL